MFDVLFMKFIDWWNTEYVKYVKDNAWRFWKP